MTYEDKFNELVKFISLAYSTANNDAEMYRMIFESDIDNYEKCCDFKECLEVLTAVSEINDFALSLAGTSSGNNGSVESAVLEIVKMMQECDSAGIPLSADEKHAQERLVARMYGMPVFRIEEMVNRLYIELYLNE